MKLTEGEKLKYWIDAEFSILHVMFAGIMLQLTSDTTARVILWVYMVWSVVYAIVRAAYIAKSDSDFLRVPKK